MPRHRCELWTSLGLNCPGLGPEEARKKKKRKKEEEVDEEQMPFHKFANKKPNAVHRTLALELARRLVRFLRWFTAKRGIRIAIPTETEVDDAIGKPFDFGKLRFPIPEIAMTGATAAAIMLAERAFGARAEEFVTDAIARQGKGRTSTARSARPGTVGKGVAGTGFQFNAARDLAAKLGERRKRHDSGQPGGGFFPGILG